MPLVVSTRRRIGTPPAPPPVASSRLLAIADPQCSADSRDADGTRWVDHAALCRTLEWDEMVVAGDLCDSWTTTQQDAFSAGYDTGTPNLRSVAHVAWGNHDVGAARTPSWNYIGAPLGGQSLSEPWHSFDMPNGWHIVCADFSRTFNDLQAGSAQLAWLEADLDAHTGIPTMVVYHISRYSSTDTHGDNPDGADCWAALLARPWVEAVISGHQHVYERYARMDNTGNVDAVNGIRQFNLATPGFESARVFTTKTGLEVRHDHTRHGVTVFTLYDDRYEWENHWPASRPAEAMPDTGSQTIRYPLGG